MDEERQLSEEDAALAVKYALKYLHSTGDVDRGGRLYWMGSVDDAVSELSTVAMEAMARANATFKPGKQRRKSWAWTVVRNALSDEIDRLYRQRGGHDDRDDNSEGLSSPALDSKAVGMTRPRAEEVETPWKRPGSTEASQGAAEGMAAAGDEGSERAKLKPTKRSFHDRGRARAPWGGTHLPGLRPVPPSLFGPPMIYTRFAQLWDEVSKSDLPNHVARVLWHLGHHISAVRMEKEGLIVGPRGKPVGRAAIQGYKDQAKKAAEDDPDRFPELYRYLFPPKSGRALLYTGIEPEADKDFWRPKEGRGLSGPYPQRRDGWSGIRDLLLEITRDHFELGGDPVQFTFRRVQRRDGTAYLMPMPAPDQWLRVRWDDAGDQVIELSVYELAEDYAVFEYQLQDGGSARAKAQSDRHGQITWSEHQPA